MLIFHFHESFTLIFHFHESSMLIFHFHESFMLIFPFHELLMLTFSYNLANILFTTPSSITAPNILLSAYPINILRLTSRFLKNSAFLRLRLGTAHDVVHLFFVLLALLYLVCLYGWFYSSFYFSWFFS